MKIKKNPKKMENRSFKLAGAKLKGYEYTKTYYIMENGKPKKLKNGNDSALTIINIKKAEQSQTSEKKAFVFSEGYIGAERSYNEDGTKRKSLSRKSGFGMSFLINYINNAKENNIDDFYVLFMSDKEKSENQAELFAEAIKDIGRDENISSINMWCHSKSGLLALRTFQKLKDENSIEAEKTLGKVKAILTSMPVKGTTATDRKSFIEKLDKNKMFKILPSWFKTMALSFYDKRLYKPTPAQVDIKKPKPPVQEVLAPVVKERSKIQKIFDKIWGNDAYKKHVENEKSVKYDAGYLPRITDSKNMEKIKDVNYKTLPVDLKKEDAIISLLKQGQVMPFILYAKKVLSKAKKGDGINTYDDQGLGDDNYLQRLKVDIDNVVRASHDTPTTQQGMETIAEELTKKEEETK